jgi:hypothetical protein
VRAGERRLRQEVLGTPEGRGLPVEGNPPADLANAERSLVAFAVRKNVDDEEAQHDIAERLSGGRASDPRRPLGDANSADASSKDRPSEKTIVRGSAAKTAERIEDACAR